MTDEVTKRNINTLHQMIKKTQADLEDTRSLVITLQAENALLTRRLDETKGQIGMLLAKLFSGGATSGN